MKYVLAGFGACALLAGVFFLLAKQTRVMEVPARVASSTLQISRSGADTASLLSANVDIEPEQPLASPPSVVKALYLTSWSAGNSKKIATMISLMRAKGLNAAVIDIKDYSGYVGYDSAAPEVIQYRAKEIRIPRINALLKKLHDAGIYVIGRITVFQDPVLARARPNLALHDARTGKVWRDRKGLEWLDPASVEVWAYAVSIAKDALARGFDEANFDYVRFPSDGNLAQASFPFWDGKEEKALVIRDFFRYLRKNLPDAKISADLFGLVTVREDDMGIGQMLEYAYESFDYVSPMVYPSHYSAGFLQYRNPADHPYEVVRYSMEKALERFSPHRASLRASSTAAISAMPLVPSGAMRAKLRPWLQEFDLGAIYTAHMIRAQIKAVEDVLNHPSTSNRYAGWLLWDPENFYTRL